MPAYNPIVRMFCRLRAALTRVTAVPRHQIRPDTPLDQLLPRNQRRQLWQEARQTGLSLPDLDPPPFAIACGCLGAVAIVVTALVLDRWPGLLLAPLLLWLMFRVGRAWATEFPVGVRTVGELALLLTHYATHRHSGYRWTHNEIATKVRMVVADSLGLPLDDVGLKTNFHDLTC